jgi:hypothetical protein
MPIRQRKLASPHPKAPDLRLRLAEEWRHPNDTALEPVIIEEAGIANRPTHLYVIWEEWGELNQQERSEIIMDAYEEVRGRDKALEVTVAMGLTPQEARRMNIDYK